jgi:hypothetical protein
MEHFSMDSEGILSMVDFRLVDHETLVIGNIEGLHYHWDPFTEFYNSCHGSDGKFCPTGGAGRGGGGGGVTGKATSGKTALHDPDGDIPSGTMSSKRGKMGGSLADPHEGTREIDGIRGYDAKGKPVPGSDAWLEAHGISKQIFNARPYVKYEADKNDPALKEGYKNYPQAEKFFSQRAEQDGQTGGYLMYKHEVPGSPWGPIAPQARPNKAVVTNAAKRAYAETVLANDRARLEVVKKTTPTALRAERRAQLKAAELNLSRIKSATPEKIKIEAAKNLAKAHDTLDKAKKTGNPVSILEAKKGLVNEKRQHDKDIKRANNWREDKELYDAETSVKHAQSRLQRSIDDPKAALDSEIKSQERSVVRSESRFEKTAAKYVFPPGTSSARIDMNPDPQNVKNLTEGKGRIYFAMEGSIKNDAVLTALKKEDPTAAVVNVPSVTLWQQKAGLPGEASGEVMWFARKYGKGREIILMPDADGVTNPNVMMQAKALSTALRSNGAGGVIVAAPPLKAGTKKQIDHFSLPSGIDEGRKGVDDHLGAGRGTLGQLQYTNVKQVPKYDLSEYTKLAGATDQKINRNSIKNTEAALAAISGIAGPAGVSRMPKKMLAQTANLPLTSAKEARDRLEKLGIISVEHIFDEQALSRGKRIRNPKVSDERVQELVKKGVIKEPRLDQPFTEVTIEESPVVTIRDPRFIIKQEHVETGTLQDLPSWDQPKSFKGWTSPINGASDKTGIAARQVEQANKAVAKKAAAAPPPLKVAPPGRMLVRSKAGAKRYGVAIGQPIPIAEDVAANILDSVSEIVSGTVSGITSMTLLDPDAFIAEEFYNHKHGKGGLFAPTGGGTGGSGDGVTGKVGKGNWPAAGGRPITKLNIKDPSFKAAYEVTANNGNKIRLYDVDGKVGSYKNDLLQNHARMNEMYPLSPPRGLIVMSPRKGSLLSKNDTALVNSEHNYTFVNEKALGADTKNMDMMPSSLVGNTKNMNYLMTHEYGHQLDFSKNASGDNYKAHPLTKNAKFNAALSSYGKSHPVEAYAEAFAEWHHSNGTTKNPAARAMARYEGWNGAPGTGKIVSTIIKALNDLSALDTTTFTEYSVSSMIAQNLVHFNGDVLSFAIEKDIVPEALEGVSSIEHFEKGSATVIAKVIEPSEEEIAAANQIMDDVLTELEKKG